jgi:hypothetical protein
VASSLSSFNLVYLLLYFYLIYSNTIEIIMAVKTTLVEIKHDEGYGDMLLMHINNSLRGKDMIAMRIVEKSGDSDKKIKEQRDLEGIFWVYYII